MNENHQHFSADISEVVLRYLKKSHDGKQGKYLFKTLCPFHKEKTPSFVVYPNNFHCFGCGKTGDAIDFVMAIEETTYDEALKKIEDAGIDVVKREKTEKEKREEELKEKRINEAYSSFLEHKCNKPKNYTISLVLQDNDLKEMKRRHLFNFQLCQKLFFERYLDSLWETDFEFLENNEDKEKYVFSCDMLFEVEYQNNQLHPPMMKVSEEIINKKNRNIIYDWYSLEENINAVDCRSILLNEVVIDCDYKWGFIVNQMREVFFHLKNKYPSAIIFLSKHGKTEKNCHIHFISMCLNEIIEVKEYIKKHYAFDTQMLYSTHLERSFGGRYQKIFKETKNKKDITFCSAYSDFKEMKVCWSGKDVVYPFIEIKKTLFF